ncbi:hypothetical protein [Nannocystis exedens]|nr:hypothetical protein [Nannocystis exedens]
MLGQGRLGQLDGDAVGQGVEWTLKVASEFGPLPAGDRRIDSWRIEFE